MIFEGKRLEEITKTDLECLKEARVSESKTVDYKRADYGNRPLDKKEFLSDVSSFANTAGGYLFIGVEESKGLPTALKPLKIDNPDAERGRMESLIRTGLQPRIYGIQIRAVPVDYGFVIILRIPKSWSAPHMVVLEGHGRFYGRNSAGKYSLDVGELRTAFSLSESGNERIRNFRIDRIAKILDGEELPVKLRKNSPKVVLHILPLSMTDDSRSQIDISKLRTDRSQFAPVGRGISGSRINFDGLLCYDLGSEGNASAYVQIFRSGCIEMVEADMLAYHGDKKIIPGSMFESEILRAVSSYLSALSKHEVTPPIILMLSLLELNGYKIAFAGSFGAAYTDPIERDNLITPEVIMQDFGENVAAVMKPAFDTVWNACGQAQSKNYTADGNWIGS